ncbi:btb poz domain-containing protein [Diplodia corticola]|uniref:Btb poz domain-containing protein n=1 Tax=Diplodia corticola TaxID=236234 RepID=A0A1J9QMI3_9PEZI|nr:btb poz domain-containing protein [Diplodia corticola]OJD29689.1 btb poz domain-containing protein [Diplodia corticola]
MTSTDPDSNVEAVHEIYPDGDILLVCGPNKVVLLIHSIFLTNASKVFAAMLNGNFREGQPQANGGRRTIPLPEDDPFAMECICASLHSRNERLPNSMTPKQLLAIAYAADKYDLVSSLRIISSHWFSANKATQSSFHIEDFWSTMAAAYILKDDDFFRSTTATIVLNHDQSFLGLDQLAGNIVPSEITLSLEEKRNSVRLALMQLLYRQAYITPNDCSCMESSRCTCGWNAQHCYEYMQKLGSTELLPEKISRTALHSVFTTMALMHQKFNLGLYFVTKLDELLKSCGISLDAFEQAEGYL